MFQEEANARYELHVRKDMNHFTARFQIVAWLRPRPPSIDKNSRQGPSQRLLSSHFIPYHLPVDDRHLYLNVLYLTDWESGRIAI